MPPPDADFGIKIDFKKGEGNPRRVFDAASLLIEGFERLDGTVIEAIDSKIEPVLVLEDVEAGSIRIWLRNVLTAFDDEALKKLDWKPQVGKYLVRTKYAALRWLDSGDQSNPPQLRSLADELRQIARETDVRHLPDYAPVHEGRLLSALDKVQDAKKQLSHGDKLYIEADEKTYEVDLSRDWSPTAAITPNAERETHSHGEMIITVRKPDMIGNTMWQFRHGKVNVTAPIKDDDWLTRYHGRHIDIRPGDALRCWVRFSYTYDATGRLKGQTIEIEKVYEIIPGPAGQGDMLDG
jgi:hypothetical protein